MSALADRVRGLLHGPGRPGWMDERAAAELLYPARRQVQGTPVNPPLNARTPTTLARLSGAREEQVSVVRKSTP